MAPGVGAYPAALPGFVAVGGTSLALSGGAPTARGFGESAWSGAGSGCNTHSGIVKPTYQPDTFCAGRSYADVSAVADPNTGLIAYSTSVGGWFLVGGTSLASPLVAAYEAVTGINDATPKWAYDNSSLLNDPVSGSNGSCSISYICNAVTGYDGPTGMGSISGAIVSGAPGVAAPSKSAGYMTSASAVTATLAGGVYPNGLDTSYYWEYGTSTSYGTQTAASGIGSGRAPVLSTNTLTNLLPSTTYHYRLVATNSAGTSYGYDYSFTTASAGSIPPTNTTPPVISGTPQQGQTLTVSTGIWSPPATSYSYQWQRSTDGGTTWTSITSATGDDLRPRHLRPRREAARPGHRLELLRPGRRDSPRRSARSRSGAPTNTTPPVISGITRRGQVLTVSSNWTPARHHELPVAAHHRRRHDVGQRRHELDQLHARGRRPRRQPPRHRHHRQRVRPGGGDQQHGRPDRHRPADDHGRPGRDRHHPAHLPAHHHARHLERHRQHLRATSGSAPPTARAGRRSPARARPSTRSASTTRATSCARSSRPPTRTAPPPQASNATAAVHRPVPAGQHDAADDHRQPAAQRAS